MHFLFADHILDTDRRELRRGSEPIAVEPQVLDLLIYLMQNRDRVVSKDDLIASIWGGRIVSDATLTSRIYAARKAVGDSGKGQKLIRTIARKGLRFVGAVRTQSNGDKHSTNAPSDELWKPVPLPDKPSIAVLPFQNLSGDLEKEYFADGVVEEITTALSRMRWLFVIARNSSFIYKGHAVDVKQIGHELGVRYVLEGSVRKAGNKVRITGQLIDALTGAHLWADRFEGELEDVFDLQDRVTASVVGAIAPKLEQAEIERARRKPPANLDAYDYFLRGMAGVHQWTKEANAEALRLFYRAIELDPTFASAYGMAARCYSQRKGSGWVEDRMQEVAETKRLAWRAAALGRDDAVALCTAGHGLAFVGGDPEAGAALIEQALQLNPNLAAAWLFSGWVKVWLGEPESAIEHVARAMRLSPHDPQASNMQAATACAHFFAGRYSEASSWADMAVWAQSNYFVLVCCAAASHALAGHSTKAHQAIARLRQLHPELRISNLKELLPIQRSEDLARLADGLRRAGLP